MNKFSALLETFATYQSTVIIVGDFNILCDVADDVHTARLQDLLNASGLQQHVNKPNHTNGHNLDLIITTVDTQLSNIYVDPPVFSDHDLVTCSLPFSSQSVNQRCLKLSHRLNTVDKLAILVQVQASSLCVFSLVDLPLTALCASYSTVLRRILDDLVPAKATIAKDCPRSSWFDSDCRNCRRLTRSLKTLL